MNKNKTTQIMGLLLIIVGIGYLGDQFNCWHFSIFFEGWWAALLAIFGIMNMLENKINAFNLIITMLGIYLFLDANGWIYFHLTFQMIVAALLVIAGLRMLFFKNEGSKPSASEIGGEHLCVENSFGANRYRCKEKLYTCEIKNNFGSFFVDLSEADLSELYEITIENNFGSLDLLLPHNVKIKANEDHFLTSVLIDQSEGTKEIYVKERCSFASLKIRKVKR